MNETQTTQDIAQLATEKTELRREVGLFGGISVLAGIMFFDFEQGEWIANFDKMLVLPFGSLHMGYVTQHTGLFEHLTVRENLALPAQLAHWDAPAIERRLAQLAEQFSLPKGDFFDSYPYQLSAVEKQRVCIARAFVADPAVLLMDDPFAALEPGERSRMQDEFVTMQALLRKTVVFITSQIEEAIKIADRLCIMEKGRVLQYDKPEEILTNPHAPGAARVLWRVGVFDPHARAPARAHFTAQRAADVAAV